MSYSTKQVDNNLVVRFNETSLVFPDQVRSLESELAGKEGAKPPAAILDFQDVTHISSAVWGAIIILNKQLREDARRMILCGLDENLSGALDAMKLDQLLSVSDNEDSALGSLQE